MIRCSRARMYKVGHARFASGEKISRGVVRRRRRPSPASASSFWVIHRPSLFLLRAARQSRSSAAPAAGFSSASTSMASAAAPSAPSPSPAAAPASASASFASAASGSGAGGGGGFGFGRDKIGAHMRSSPSRFFTTSLDTRTGSAVFAAAAWSPSFSESQSNAA
eukprot:30886-Pelagococcus_subviridis.AAC.22